MKLSKAKRLRRKASLLARTSGANDAINLRRALKIVHLSGLLNFMPNQENISV